LYSEEKLKISVDNKNSFMITSYNYSKLRSIISLLIYVAIIQSCTTNNSSAKANQILGNRQSENNKNTVLILQKKLKEQHIILDGKLNDWKQKPFLKYLTAPWKNNRKDKTKFDYKINNGYFYFYFKVIDSTLTITPYVNEKSVIKSDRVELFFSCDNTLSNYYCIEIDPKGFILDYHAQTYRKFRNDWNCESIEIASLINKQGYAIEGRISIKELQNSGIVDTCYLGVFRADLLNYKTANWYSWMIPNSDKPDFHIPSALKKISIE